MAMSLKIGSRHPLRAMTAAAVATLAIVMALSTGVATGQDQGIDRSVIPMAPDAPDRYVVQPGDTLWDISAKFLTDPWYWPEIWHVNPQVANPHLIYPGDELALTWVDGRPQVSIASGGATRLSPRVRANPLSGAIEAIPYDRIAAFMSRIDVLEAEQIESAPYVAYGRDHRLISAAGNDIYVRRLEKDAAVGNRYSVYHVGDPLRDPDGGRVLGYQGMFTGEADLKRLGDPATARMVDSTRETLEGDILVPLVGETRADFVPRVPRQEINGTIMSVIDDRTAVADYDVIIINRGASDGLEPGHVLAIWETGEEVRDTTDHAVSRKMETPAERTGLFMVFRTYEHISYGLTLRVEREIRVGDKVRTPTPAT